jgi:hypothetical protein
MKHPDREDIEKYIYKELSEEREIAIGEHIDECETCRMLSQDTFRKRVFLTHLTAEAHGRVYWHKRVKDILEKARQAVSIPEIKNRLENWTSVWREKVGGAIHVVCGERARAVEVITDIAEGILAPHSSWQFAHAVVVRGTGKEDGQIKIVSSGKPGIQIITDIANRKAVVQIEDVKKIPPLIILSPLKGEPIVALPKKVEGTNLYAAYFGNIPPGEYTLIVEPKEG